MRNILNELKGFGKFMAGCTMVGEGVMMALIGVGVALTSVGALKVTKTGAENEATIKPTESPTGSEYTSEF